MVAQNMLRRHEVDRFFSRKKIGFDDSFNVTKCLQQIGMPDLFHMCVPSSEQPSNINTMVKTKSIRTFF